MVLPLTPLIPYLSYPQVSVPAKDPFVSTIKSNNYLNNALCKMECEDKGGSGNGIFLHPDDGRVLEGAVANIAVVVRVHCEATGGDVTVLRTPKLEGVLDGTTLLDAMGGAGGESGSSAATAAVVGPTGTSLFGELCGGGEYGVVDRVEFCDLYPEDLYAADEVMELSGHVCTAIVEVDGNTIKGGTPGPVALAIAQTMTRVWADQSTTIPISLRDYT